MSEQRRTVKTTAVSLDVVDLLKRRDGARLTEIAESLGMAKSTVHAHLSTLVDRGYVAREGDTYHVGIRFLEMGTFARDRREGSDLVEDYLAQIARETDELSTFMIEENGMGVFTHDVEGENGVKTIARLGARYHLHQLATGKVILARLPESRVRTIFETHGLPGKTPNTITDRATLFEELERIRDYGFATNEEEFMEGLHAVAVPVTDRNGGVLGAIGVGGPARRMVEERLEEELPSLLLGIANELEINVKHS